MTVPASTAPTFKQWLTTTIAAAATAATGFRLVVSYGEPDSRADDFIVIGDTLERTVEHHVITGAMGAGSLRETYVIPVEIKVARGTTPLAAETRAFALVAVVETVIRETVATVIGSGNASSTFGGNVWHVIPGEHDTTTELSAGESKAWVTTCTYPIQVQAVL